MQPRLVKSPKVTPLAKCIKRLHAIGLHSQGALKKSATYSSGEKMDIEMRWLLVLGIGTLCFDISLFVLQIPIRTIIVFL